MRGGSASMPALLTAFSEEGDHRKEESAENSAAKDQLRSAHISHSAQSPSLKHQRVRRIERKKANAKPMTEGKQWDENYFLEP